MTAPALPSSGQDDDEPLGGEMTLFEHLDELRSRLFRTALAFASGFVLGFAANGVLFRVLIAPYCELPSALRSPTAAFDSDSCQLIVTNPLGELLVTLKVASILAVVIGGPVFFYQLYRFVTPGLKRSERRYAVPFLVLSFLLFIGGALFAYAVIPRGLEFLLSFGGGEIAPLLDASEYISFILKTLIAFGVSFEFPLVIAVLTLVGVVTHAGLTTYRRHAIFGTFVLTAILTPTGDPFTMSVMAIPLIIFYEGNIIFARSVERRRRRAATA